MRPKKNTAGQHALCSVQTFLSLGPYDLADLMGWEVFMVNKMCNLENSLAGELQNKLLGLLIMATLSTTVLSIWKTTCIVLLDLGGNTSSVHRARVSSVDTARISHELCSILIKGGPNNNSFWDGNGRCEMGSEQFRGCKDLFTNRFCSLCGCLSAHNYDHMTKEDTLTGHDEGNKGQSCIINA